MEQPEAQKEKRGFAASLILYSLIILLVILLATAAMLVSTLGQHRRRVGEPVLQGNNAATGGTDCTNAQLSAQYKAWVKDAAAKWMGGDEAALIALIKLESDWRPRNFPPAKYNSTAAGLGQFLTSTAESMPEFRGGNDGKGKTWPAGKLHHWSPGQQGEARFADDARFDPERSIYAAAHYFGAAYKPGKDIGEAYARGYHRGANLKSRAQQGAAWEGARKLRERYTKLLSDECQGRNPSGGGTTTARGNYAPPIKAAILKNKIPLREHHHGSVAVDIGVPIGTDIYAFTSGEVVRILRSRATIKYDGGTGRGIPNRCGTGFSLRGDDGIVYTYCHMDSVASNITQGSRVTAGQYMGKSGNTGRSSGPHLHLGARGITAAELRNRIESTVK